MEDFKLVIDGKLVAGASTIDVINPATEEVLAQCPRADERQLQESVAAAKRAFPAWAARSVAERAELINQLADALQSRAADLARLLTLEQGKPLVQASWEIHEALSYLRYFATLDLPIKMLRYSKTEHIVEQRTPLGVVAAITPWNVPIVLLVMKLGPALLSGNTVVVKPAPTTPLTTLKLGAICSDVLPPGVVNVIVDQNDLGDMLTRHPDVAKIAFTGSAGTGRKVMQSAASGLKRFTLELGGNDAAIVLDDIDPKEAAAKVFRAAMLNAGQICVAAKRAYVPDSMYDTFVNELVVLANNAIVDDGLNQGTEIGPIQNRTQFEKLKGYLEEASRRGTVVAGGSPLKRRGYFIPPTIVRDIPDDSRLVCEEQFGPILPVLSYSSEEELVARVNATDYGLAGTIWTSSPQRGYELALRIQSGTVWVNKYLDFPADTRIGGAKQSGLGAALGLDGLYEYTQAKIINVAR